MGNRGIESRNIRVQARIRDEAGIERCMTRIISETRDVQMDMRHAVNIYLEAA